MKYLDRNDYLEIALLSFVIIAVLFIVAALILIIYAAIHSSLSGCAPYVTI